LHLPSYGWPYSYDYDVYPYAQQSTVKSQGDTYYDLLQEGPRAYSVNGNFFTTPISLQNNQSIQIPGMYGSFVVHI
jgi:hypothetical protein